MINVYADAALVYDSRLEKYDLMALQTTGGLNKGGTLTLTMNPQHPAYNYFTSFKTLVTLYDNGVRKFRGRALYPSDDLYNCRTITCEGERCFLRDGVIRPYLYQDTPAAIFADALAQYNAQVDDFKKFTLGEITVSDANDYIRFESETAEKFDAFFDKLVSRCGGYITFTDDGNGGSIINWLAEIGSKSTQPITFGHNLLEFALSGQSDELATALIPYGAQLEDGTRVTIKSVNGGKDWIEDAAAVALRGRIFATQTWDDVTDPANLMNKAEQWLAEHKLVVTSLKLTALDLSRIDRKVASYTEGDFIPVYSKPHGIDEYFQLTDRTIDWLNPDGGDISLGKTAASLTGADVMNDRDTNAKIVILNNAVINGKVELQEAQRVLTSKIEQLADSITLEVSGGLGNSAAIRLNVNGESYTETLDLSEVRKAFANDPSSITLSAGKITFNSNTIVINSSNFTLDSSGNIKATGGEIGGWTLKNYKLYAGDGVNIKTVAVQAPTSSNLYVFAAGGTSHDSYADCPFRVTKAGKLYATDAVIVGEITAIDTPYKTRIANGSVDFYFNDELCGSINTKYYVASTHAGINLQVEPTGEYFMITSPNEEYGTGYHIDYYLDCGFTDSMGDTSAVKWKHVFQSSALFHGPVRISGLQAHGIRLFDNSFIKAFDGDIVGAELLGYDSDDEMVCVGGNGYDMKIRGETIYIPNTTITYTSDRNAKNSIEALPEAYEAFVDALEPVRFKYNEGTSGRYHVGYIAQDVMEALTAAGLTSQDFAGYVDIGRKGTLGLQYVQFIAILHKKIKRLEAQVAALKTAQ